MYAFLLTNSRPENREYSYDYFYDNCATRIRDVFQQVLGDALQFHYHYADTLDYTIRGLTDKYLESSSIYSWGDLGIDIGLGANIDNQASPYQYMYQPEYLSLAFASATIMHPNGQTEALTRPVDTLFKSSANPTEEQLFFTPTLVFWLLFLLVFILSIVDIIYHKNNLLAFDILFFFVFGVIGALITFLWFFTNHTSSQNNWNLLWALPTHLIVCLLIRCGKPVTAIKAYFSLTAALSLLTLLFWRILPQNLNEALVPVLLVVLLRSALISTKTENFRGILMRKKTFLRAKYY